MVGDSITLEVSPEFKTAISDAMKEVDDLRVPFASIKRSWFRSNKAIFVLKSPGQYADLSSRPVFAKWEDKKSPLRRFFPGGYKEYKKAKYGFVYPILRATGVLEKSITEPGAQYGIASESKITLTLGSKVPYGEDLQLGNGKMPARPFVLTGAEQTATGDIKKRQEAWTNIVKDFVMQKVAQRLGTF